MKMSLKWIMAALAVSHVALAVAEAQTPALRGTDAAAPAQGFEAKNYGGRPGSQALVKRTFDKQPPVIPHAVLNFDEITLEDNQCLSCHGPDTYVKKEAPRVGDSHFTDRDGNKHDTIVGSRYACTLCHVPQADAPALVDNTFKASGKVTQAKWKSKKPN